MKSPIKNVFLALIAALFLATAASAQTSNPLPTADDVISKMMQSDAQRSPNLAGYAAVRRYAASNGKRHAEMVVGVTCSSDGSKSFSVLSGEGSGSIRKHVFRKLLKEEGEASRRGTRDSTRITPANYQFQMIGQETLDTGPAYVLAVVPKTANKYLIDGKIWVDASDYSIVRIEGQPARNPSFWVRSVHFVHTYEKVGPFWLAASTHTTSDIRIFGPAELTIENSAYVLEVSKNNAANLSETIR
jgi:hypothetical protein